MKWFYDLKISTKLLAGFILVAVIAGAMGVFGMINIKTLDKSDSELYQNMTVPISELSTIGISFQRVRINLRDIVETNDNAEIAEHENTIRDLRKVIDKESALFEKTILSQKVQDAYDDFINARKAYGTVIERVIELAKQNKDDEAYTLLNGDGKKAAFDENAAIDKLVEMKVADAKQKAEDNTKQANNTMLIMGILIVLVMTLSIILGWFVSRIISKPLKQAVHMIKEMSMGHLGMRLKMHTKDEIGQMAAAMDGFADDLQNVVIGTMRKISEGDLSSKITPKDNKDEISPALSTTIDTLNSFIGEMQNMATQHDLGDIDITVAEGKFQGAYKVMAKGVNDMVNGHISVKKKAMACVAEFAKGNFDAELEKFPGKKAFINENMEALRKNLKDVNTEITQLVNAAIEGKLSTRANADIFQGDWKKLTQGLNTLLEAVIKPVQEAASVLNEMSNGNLQMRVTGNYNGDHAEIKNALNETLDALSAYVDEISNVLTEMANSNMVVEISGDYKGDFAPIKQALNLIIESFNQVLSDINNAADQVAAGSRQVSDGSQALSQGATEQASSIEQLTASITEIAAQTKQNAVSANEANELAVTAKNNAADGNAQMKDMLKAMEEINISSANISKIIKVIDEIAFQTNILALNAAVEAARAGQHGKGFAVVAEEVRNLAARSASAAKETTGLIEGSIKKVETGTKIANETAAALDKIVNDVAKAANLVGTIATASNEQATGIAQVNQGVEQVSMVVQTNSATAEESAAASEELSSQADLLKEMIGRFRLKNGERQSIKSHHLDSGMKRMLFDGGNAKRQGADNRNSRRDAGVRKNAKIALSDGEFGKY